MKRISNIVYFCLISFVVRIICKDSVEQINLNPRNVKNVKNGESIRKFCSYVNPIVRVYAAVEVNKALLMIITIQKPGNKEPNDFTVIKVLYVDKEYGNNPLAHLYEARRWGDMERFINAVTAMLSMQSLYRRNFVLFRALNYKTMTFANQTFHELHYFSFHDRATEALELEVNLDEDRPQPPFRILNRKMVYQQYNDRNNDKSVFLNLELLYHHFPKEINITDILIFNRFMGTRNPPRYNAMVYTSERLKNGEDFYARHYLTGTAIHYKPENSNDYDFWRMDWKFDTNEKSCKQMRNKVWAVTQLHQYIGQNDYNAFKFVEFYGTEHRVLELLFFNQGNSFEIVGDEDWDNMRSNSLFLSCAPEPTVASDPLIDCRRNEKLSPNYSRESDRIKDDHIYGSSQKNESSQMFWHWFFILALMVAILSFTAFGIYLVVTADKVPKSVPDYY